MSGMYPNGVISVFTAARHSYYIYGCFSNLKYIYSFRPNFTTASAKLQIKFGLGGNLFLLC